MTIGEIDPLEDGPAVEDEHIQPAAIARRIGKFAEQIRAFFQLEQLLTESVAASFGQRVQLLDHRPGKQQTVALHPAVFSDASLRLNSSPVIQWLGSLSSISPAMRRLNSCSSRLLRPIAMSWPINSLRFASGMDAASATICSMLMLACYAETLRRQAATHTPGSRRQAAREGIAVGGVPGELLHAKSTGLVPAVRAEIERLKREARFFIDGRIEAFIPGQAGD